jgi:Zn-dependent protease
VNTIWMLMTFIAFLMAMGLHYGAQAFVAAMLGDGSPARERRLTLNPARHLAALGTVVALISAFPASGGLLATSAVPIGLGWGKPIRPNATRLSVGPNTGLVIIGLTGIAVNIIIGILVAVLLAFLPTHITASSTLIDNCAANLQGGPLQSCLQAWQPGWALRLEEFAVVFASVNVLVGLLNIIPLFPLDGYHILYAFLPTKAAISYRNGESWQELVLLGLLFFLPFLLQLIGASPQADPFVWIQTQSFNIVISFSNVNYLALLGL